MQHQCLFTINKLFSIIFSPQKGDTFHNSCSTHGIRTGVWINTHIAPSFCRHQTHDPNAF